MRLSREPNGAEVEGRYLHQDDEGKEREQVGGRLSSRRKGSGVGEVLREEPEGMETEVTEPGEMVESQGRGCLVRGAGWMVGAASSLHG